MIRLWCLPSARVLIFFSACGYAFSQLLIGNAEMIDLQIRIPDLCIGYLSKFRKGSLFFCQLFLPVCRFRCISEIRFFWTRCPEQIAVRQVNADQLFRHDLLMGATSICSRHNLAFLRSRLTNRAASAVEKKPQPDAALRGRRGESYSKLKYEKLQKAAPAVTGICTHTEEGGETCQNTCHRKSGFRLIRTTRP